MENPKPLSKYLEQGDGCCNCHDYAIDGGPFEQDGVFVTQNVWCMACGAEWTNVFKLVNIRNFKIEEAGNGTG